MRPLKLIAVLIPLLFAVGCAKKTAKKSAADDSPVAKSQPQRGGPSADKGTSGEKGEEPNWLNDPRFKKGSDALPAESSPGGKPGWGEVPAPAGGWPAAPGVNPAAAGGPAPGRLPAAPGVPGTGGVTDPALSPTGIAPTYKPVSEADMKEVWVFIENASGSTGKMPAPLLTYQALVSASSAAAPLVKDGSITLTGAATRESIWAYETRALTSGGLVASSNGVETLTAAQLKARLGK